MPNNVMAFLYSDAYQQNGTWALPLGVRLAILEGTLTKSQSWMTQRVAELTTAMPFKGVYLVPEYYFTKPNQWNEREPLNEEDRVKLEPQLLAISAKFPEILIVPGTVFYAKPLVRTQNSFQYKFDPATGTRTLLKTGNVDRRDRVRQRLGSYVASFHAGQTDADPGFYRTWGAKGYQAGAHAVPALSQVSASLRNRNKDPWILRNSAYVLLGGKRIAKYDKQTDWGEALGNSPDQLAFLPGVQKQCPEVGGYRIGVEVCADHANGMLARRQVTPLHFHFVVSDWVFNSPGNMAMSAGGYFAHASTNHTYSSLWWRDGRGAPTDLSKSPAHLKHSQGCPGSMLDGYVISLPAPLVPPVPTNAKELLGRAG